MMVGVFACAACTAPAVVDPDELPVPTDETGVPLPPAGTATLRAGTVVLPAAMTRDAVVELAAVVFPATGNDALLALARGDVIVSGTGDGFIRRVYAVTRDGDRIRVRTSSATLADAVVEATFHVEAAAPLALSPRIDGGTLDLTAAITGELAIAPALALDVVIDEDGLAAFDLAITGAGTTAIAGALDFTSPEHRAWGEERQWETPLFRRAYALGPLPIVVAGRLTTTLAASAYVDAPVAFTGGARAALGIDASAHFTRASGWTTTDASRVDVTQIGPAHAGAGRASLVVGIDPRVELSFYGAGGPALHLVAQAGGFGAYCGDALLTGLQAAVQGAVAFDLDALASEPRTDVTLWDTRPFLDDFEQCAP